MEISLLYNYFKESTGVATDTRKINQGNIFFALKGPNFNANLFAGEAIEKGAKYAVVDDRSLADEKTIFYVPDTLIALQKLANYHRKTLNIPVIGLTGSNGKTTTKELIHCVLNTKFKVTYTQGNL
ncbi:MAG: Mur ligase family protein, partial [Cyclobacteriaceae bacterium]|nr:Mur ligase family protein [Cyclobacteriaceae bacterium]